MKELAPSSFGLSLPSDRGDVEGLSRPPVIEKDGISLQDYWRVLRKRLYLIAIFCFGTVLATALVISIMTPIYTAESTLLIERHPPQVLNIREVLSEPLLPLDEDEFYKTQYAILQSRTLAAWGIQAQGLEKNRLLTGEGRGEGFVARLWAEAKGWITEQEWARRFFPSPPRADGDNRPGVKPALIDSYMGMLEIKPLQRTRLVKIAFNTPDPELSAHLANTHAQAYIQQGLGLRTRASEEAQHFLEEKLVGLKRRIETSEAALNRYRRDRKIISLYDWDRKNISLDDKENIVVERLADLNRRLTEAEADRIALEAQVHLIRKRDYDSLPAVINSALIRSLKEQLARLEGEYAYLSTQFRPGYPRLDQLNAQVEESQRRLRQEIQRTVAGIESSYFAADAKEKALRAKMEEQKAAALGLKDASVQYAILAREVDTNRQLYDSVLQRMKETGVAAELRTSNVSIIDQAEPPRAPSKPQKKKSLLLSALMGLMGGVGLALFLEYLDNTLKTPEEVERYLRLPNLGVVPDFLRLDWQRHASRRLPSNPAQIPSSLASGAQLAPVPIKHPLSVVTEAYRMLRAAILLSRAGESPRTVLFTSSIPGEGKTVTAISIAILFSQMGVRVLVIDADLRRPGCHRVLRVENGPGLTEVLTAQREPMEVIRPTSTDHLFLLSAGSLPPNPTELVGSKKMQEVVAALREHYDHILIDSPPVMQVSDAVLLSTMVDGVVLVVNGPETPRHVVRGAHSRLNYARAKILGVVLNRINPRNRDYAYYYPTDYS
jgi:capsular exopolysaccharide synthesis family protein